MGAITRRWLDATVWRRHGLPPLNAPTSVAAPAMLMGAPSEAWSSLQLQTTAINPNAKVGCVRRYDGNFVSSFASTSGQQDVGTGRATWLSFSGPSVATINSGAVDATIAAFFASIPAGHRVLFTYLHEVDHDKLGGSTPAQYAAAQKRIWELKEANAAVPSNVPVGPVLMGTTFWSSAFLAYFPTGGEYDFIGTDPYNFGRDPADPNYLPEPKTGNAANWRPMSYLFGSTQGVGGIPYLAQRDGKPVALGEYGVHSWPSIPTRKAQWLNETDAYLEAFPTGCLAACYYHSWIGESGPWWVDRINVYSPNNADPQRQGTPGSDPNSLNAYAALLAKYWTGA